MKISIIAALAKNRVIGRDGILPWRLPRDTRWFADHTKGHPVIMGRKTFESIGKPLKDRTNIVLTTNPEYEAPGCVVVREYSQALEKALQSPGSEEIFIIGGSAVFTEFLPLAGTMYLTLVDAEVDGDTFFPAYDENSWETASVERFPADEENRFSLTFKILHRKAVTK